MTQPTGCRFPLRHQTRQPFKHRSRVNAQKLERIFVVIGNFGEIEHENDGATQPLGGQREHAQNPWEGVVIDAATALRELAEPRSPDEFIKDAIERAAKRAGLQYWRAFDIWYGKARKVRDFEIKAVFGALEKKQREAARNEFSELKARLAILESRLTQIDPDFHRPSIDQAREQMRELGAVARPGTRERR